MCQLQVHDRLQRWLSTSEAASTTSAEKTLTQQQLDIHDSAVRYARMSGALIRDYRTMYGLKIMSGYIVQAAAMSSFRLLRQLQLRPSAKQTATAASASESDDDNAAAAAAAPAEMGSSAALKECFRSILAASIHVRIVHDIAQMMCAAAIEVQSFLPADVSEMLSRLVAHVVQPAKNTEVSQYYPDYTVPAQVSPATAADLLRHTIERV